MEELTALLLLGFSRWLRMEYAVDARACIFLRPCTVLQWHEMAGGTDTGCFVRHGESGWFRCD